MEKKVLAFAMVMGMGVSAFAQEVVTDSVAVDTVAVDSALAFVELSDSVVNDSALAFYEPTDTIVADSTIALYEPADSTVTDSTKTCVPNVELAQTGGKYNGVSYYEAIAVKDDTLAAILKKENEMA